MRRAALAFIAFCACLSPVEAQAQVTLGLKGGLTLSKMNADEADGTSIGLDRRTTFGGGAYLQVGLGSVMTLQAEALYTQKGARTDDSITTLELSYIDVPLLFLVRVPAGDAAIIPILYAGPVVSFETKCQLKDSGGSSADCSADSGILFQTTSTDFGAAFGGGFEVFMGQYTLQLDIRYTHGFVNIVDSAAEQTGSAMNRTWSFYVGLGRVLAP